MIIGCLLHWDLGNFYRRRREGFSMYVFYLIWSLTPCWVASDSCEPSWQSRRSGLISWTESHLDSSSVSSCVKILGYWPGMLWFGACVIVIYHGNKDSATRLTLPNDYVFGLGKRREFNSNMFMFIYSKVETPIPASDLLPAPCILQKHP